MYIKNLPRHEEFEQGILGAVITNESNFDQVSTHINFTKFYSDKHKTIFCALEEMRRDGIPIELPTLFEKLKASKKLDDVGGSSYLTYLMELSYVAPNLGYYVKVVKEDSIKRDICYAAYETAQVVQAGKDLAEIQEHLEKQLDIIENQRPSGLCPVSAAELENIPPPESLWADIIYPGSLVQLNAEPGIGKSTIAYNICALGALGIPFLGIEFKKKIKSLYLDLETPKWHRPSKIRLIAGELPEHFSILDELDLKKEFRDLLRLCKDEQYDLLVIDTQSRVFAMEQENDNSEANYYAGLLRRLTSETGCAVLLLHHTTKGESGKAVYRGRGASAIAASVDIVANIQAITDDTLRLSIVKHRIQGSLPDLFIRKAGEDRFEPCGEMARGYESGFEVFRVQALVLDFLEKYTDPQRTKVIVSYIKTQMEVTRRTVERALETLVVSGKIVKVRRGYYALAGRETEEITTIPLPLYPDGNGGSL